MNEYSGVFWVDASVQFLSNREDLLTRAALERGGFGIFHRIGYSPVWHTHPGMYKYLPTDLTLLKLQTAIPSAGYILVYRTREVLDEVFNWNVLCSLTADCIAPPGSLALPNFRRTKNLRDWAGIHRYDQASMDILLFNYYMKRGFEYRSRDYIGKILAHRGNKKFGRLRTCSSTSN